MFNNFNVQVFTGNLVSDCEIAEKTERLIVTFSAIANYNWKTSSGESKQHAERFNVKVFASKAQGPMIRDRLVKGAKVAVMGRTITEKYTTASGGEAYWRFVLADLDHIEVLSRPTSGKDGTEHHVESTQQATPVVGTQSTVDTQPQSHVALCNF